MKKTDGTYRTYDEMVGREPARALLPASGRPP